MTLKILAFPVLALAVWSTVLAQGSGAVRLSVRVEALQRVYGPPRAPDERPLLFAGEPVVASVGLLGDSQLIQEGAMVELAKALRIQLTELGSGHQVPARLAVATGDNGPASTPGRVSRSFRHRAALVIGEGEPGKTSPGRYRLEVRVVPGARLLTAGATSVPLNGTTEFEVVDPRTRLDWLNAYHHYAVRERWQRNFTQARYWLGELLKSEPLSAAAHAELGEVAEDERDCVKATKEWLAAAQLADENADTQLVMHGQPHMLKEWSDALRSKSQRCR